MTKKAIFFILLLLIFPKTASAQQGAVLIINQIRGNEVCCQPGDTEMVDEIKGNERINKLSYAWALRYDALTDKRFVINPSSNEEIGILLEITPKLASISGVSYKGKLDGSDWFYGKNSLLIGYTVDERKHLIDTVFSEFKNKYGSYPKFTVSWMIDAWSLNYINTNYDVKLHEITKEQYETDTYTLYGGIFNYPYYPYSEHPLIPGNKDNQLDLIIIRQTISDLLRNYGSKEAFYTSQPNDYLKSSDNLDINYFQELVNNSLTQSVENNFALLGFENSFEWDKYREEFIKQLELISQYQAEKKINTQKPYEYYLSFSKTISENKPFYFKQMFSPNFDIGVLWYFGKNYRVRVIINKGKIILDDLRTYSRFPDPYKNVPATADFAYWIIPYLIDGSQQYRLTQDQEELVKKKELVYNNTLSDRYSSPFGIILGEGDFSLNEKEGEIEIVFSGNKKGKVGFYPESITIDKNLNPYFNWDNNIFLNDIFINDNEKKLSFDKQFDFLIKTVKKESALGWEYNNHFFPLFELISVGDNFLLVPKTQINTIEELAPLFQPDKSKLPIDKEKSIYYWNNRQAIVNRNPVRLFILPLNEIGRPTSISRIEIQSPEKSELKITYPDDYSYRVSPWFIDINSEVPGKKNLSLFVDGTEVIHDNQIEFIADCKKNLRFCLTSPVQIIKYVSVIFGEQKKRLSSFLPTIWK